MDYCWITICGVGDAVRGRKQAMRKMIFEHGRFNDEFVEYVGGDITKVSACEICDKLDSFAAKLGFAIVDETPMVKLDKETQKYYVAVTYKISMG